MFKVNFIYKNIKKLFINLKKKKYFLNINFFKKLFFLKKKILKKILILKKFIKNSLKKKKKNNYTIKWIYKNYLKKINKNLKLIILKIPNFIHFIIIKKNILIKKYNYKNNNNKKKIKNKIFNLKKSNKVSGRGFSYISQPLSILYLILENYMLKTYINENNYKYIIVPHILKFKSLLNSCQIPKFIKKLFIIKNNRKIKYLIPTSEISLINFMYNKKIKSKFIPLKFISKTPCYRNEKISYGKFNKGIIKQKQFDKIELINFVDYKNSYKYLKELIKNVEKIIKRFKINYRILKLSKKNTSYISTITYDLEIWIPGICNYCEVSSCSNNESYQSVRSKIKYIKNDKIFYMHIINGSGLAVGRFFLSIIENYLEKENFIKIPKILKDKIFKNLNNLKF
ncbi:aminoacyl--tRNA ligase-related protein [Candidatus Nasuia deltocephalinicola]|uniref:aminoacyl--tRNA ligase-related protein n=1 Tax=Candidatus Nasuia deltocephalincola TaxID=1160784 RepID=UPI00216AFE68|nr:aminoacyl--tRNA ligase-related protein [Candidatus Nasuia deltocephalinicola]